jgi:hypothetical protein
MQVESKARRVEAGQDSHPTKVQAQVNFKTAAFQRQGTTTAKACWGSV